MKVKKKENIWNFPNTLTLIRIIITFSTIYLILADFDIAIIAGFFIFGMVTDFFDGQIARKFKQETEFGRKFDIIADRFLMISTVLALILTYQGLSRSEIMQIFLVMSREIVSFPFALIAFASRKKIPHAKFIGKLTTFMQGVAFPAILLSIKYPIFNFSIYLAYATGFIGIVSAFYYINDLVKGGITK